MEIQFSAYIIALVFIVLIFKKLSSKADQQIERFATFIGTTLLKISLILTYFIIIAPSRLFYKPDENIETTYTQPERGDYINYEKLW